MTGSLCHIGRVRFEENPVFNQMVDKGAPEVLGLFNQMVEHVEEGCGG